MFIEFLFVLVFLGIISGFIINVIYLYNLMRLSKLFQRADPAGYKKAVPDVFIPIGSLVTYKALPKLTINKNKEISQLAEKTLFFLYLGMKVFVVAFLLFVVFLIVGLWLS